MGDVEYEYNEKLDSIKIVNGKKNTYDEINITSDHILKILTDLKIDKINKVIIGKSINMIMNNAFRELEIKELEFENDSKLNSIWDSAFENNQITKLKLPNITFIGEKAFFNNQIEEIEFHMNESKLKNIGKNAFAMNKITNLILPWSIKEIDTLAFANNMLTNIQLTDNKIDIKFGDNVFINNNNINHSKQRKYFSNLGLVLPSHIFIKSKAIK